MQKFSAQRIAVLAVIIAANVALSYVARIPIPATTGYVNLVEAGIFLVALLGGPTSGLIVGGLSGFLLDIFAGAPEWMFFSLVIHGLEGWVTGAIGANKKIGQQAIAVVAGSAIMVIGYIFPTVLFAHSWAAGWASVPSNIGQAVAGLIVSLLLIPIFNRLPQIKKYL
ncbi:ECF transporter S component [Leuconostocaceae bacterium ESL0723]|nr:ECF transporter S component [Lactobacillaceae bacterium L1_55_11]WEV54390.1 ECF transporter S component [Leuconostocaceae bacterium ESL0723]